MPDYENTGAFVSRGTFGFACRNRAPSEKKQKNNTSLNPLRDSGSIDDIYIDEVVCPPLSPAMLETTALFLVSKFRMIPGSGQSRAKQTPRVEMSLRCSRHHVLHDSHISLFFGVEVVTICDHLPGLKFSPQLPYVFTEYGAVMAASILNSPRAVQVSVYVVRAFIRLRKLLSENTALHRKCACSKCNLKNMIQRFDRSP